MNDKLVHPDVGLGCWTRQTSRTEHPVLFDYDVFTGLAEFITTSWVRFHPLTFIFSPLLRSIAMPFLMKATFIAICLTYLSTTSRAQTPYATVCGSIDNAVSSASRVAYPGQDQSVSPLEKSAYIE